MISSNNAYILNSKISTLSFSETIELIEEWLKNNKNKYICVCNTHSLVTGYENNDFKNVLKASDLCVPDGMPLVFGLKKLGFSKQERVDGPNLMLRLCKEASLKKYRILLYGGREDSLKRLEMKLATKFPGIDIVGKISPPFRELNAEEEKNIIEEINILKPDITFVSLGCPKQEKWMYINKDIVPGVMLGVGAAFEFILGDIKRPPLFFQKIGLEWLFRLISEPKRLFKRYAYNNTKFILLYFKTYKSDRRKTLKNLRHN